MCNILYRINCFFVFLFGFIWLLSPLPAVAETWPIKDFKVFKENPNPITLLNVANAYTNGLEEGKDVQAQYDQQENDLATAPPITSDMVLQIESWLGEVALEYERMGFKAPDYTDIDTTNNKEVFKVYVHPFSGGAPAGMLLGCQNSGKLYMIVDSVRNFKNGKLTVKGFQDLAHELFHAVQGSYDLFKQSGCPGFWLTEGTAEAVGIEMARKLKGKEPYTVCQIGSRPYSEQLYVRRSKIPADPPCGLPRAYQTQSFWQFLGEYVTRQHIKKKLDPEEFVPPDFRYLHRFFNTTHPMGSQSKEYVWLDKVLRSAKRYGKNQFGIKLHTAYSRFVGAMASYWKHKRRNRYPGGSGGNPSNKERDWIEKVMLSPCKNVLVSKVSASPIVIPLQIEAVAARCIKVVFDFPERVKLTFYAEDNNTSLDLEALAISTDGGKKIIRRHPGEPHPSKLGHIIVTPRSGRPQYFIVSNVAQDAAQTVSLNPNLRIVPEISSSSMAKAKKKGSTPNPKPKEELENSLESRSWTGQAIQKQRPPCTARPFEARPCGPITKLDLGLESDAGKTLRESVQPGMSFNRMMDVLGAVDQKGGEQVVLDMIDQNMEIQQQDGAGVSIVIPQIQPGFAGTIANAHMGVSKALNSDGSDNGSYDAIGPWVGSCRDGYWPSTGNVTIEEFSQYAIRGSFSAQLVDSTTRKSCQSAPIARSIDGTFTIAEINWGQNQPVPNADDDALIDRTVEDINEYLPGQISEDLKNKAKEKAQKQRQKNKQLKQQKQASGGQLKQCQNCQCQLEPAFCQANPNSKCCQFCDPMFKMCKGTAQSHAAALTTQEQAKQDAEIQEMRQRYEAYVDSLPLPNEAVRQQMLNVFDNMKTIDQKRILMMTISK